VLIAGEPGVGKTTLAAEAARRAHAAGALVLYGRSEQTLTGPYQPFAEALAHHVHDASIDVLAGLGDEAAELARLAPAVRHRLPALPEPKAREHGDRYRLFGAIARLLAASGDRLVVLVLEDLHWADAPTLLLLRHLLATSERLRLVVLAT